jgi:hypothetical protein
LGFTYDTFGRPAIHNGYVTFRAATTVPALGTRSVVRASPTNQLTRIIKTEANVNSRWLLSDPSTSLSDVAFKVVPVAGGGQPNEYYTIGATLLPAAIGAGAAQIYDGNVVFTRTGAGPSANNITLIGFNANDSNSLTFSGVAVDGNDNVPGGGGAKFAGFGDYLDHNITKNPALQNRSIAFQGFWTPFAADTGIYRWDQATDAIVAVADKNVVIPALGGTFNSGLGFLRTHVENNSLIGDPAMTTQRTARPSLYGQTTAFNYDDLATKSGAYYHNNGTVKKIADTNTPHPSLGGTFGRFHEISTIGSATAFVATGDSGASLGGEVGMSGLYLLLCGNIIEVIREGDILDGIDVTNVQLSHRGLGVGNASFRNAFLELAFRVNFADPNLAEAIYTTRTSLLCISISHAYAGGTATGASLVTTPLGSTSFIAPVFDESARLRVEMRASSGGTEATFGGDMAADLYGVDGLAGNNPALIDFALSAGVVVPEAMSLTFNQNVLAEGLVLVDFDSNDSAIIELAGTAFAVTGAEYPDGHIPLGGRLLPEGAEIRVSWDASNATGDGFSLNGVGFFAVPEPGTVALALVAISAATLRRRRAPAQ